MIASLEGKIAHEAADHVVITTSGVGYKVFAPTGSVPGDVGDTTFVHTIMIVREDAITLYGFGTPIEREMFERLISVSGVGPRMALNILSVMAIDRLHTAVASGQHEAFTRVPGIGRKTAEKIVFELKDKLKGADGLIPASAGGNVDKDVLDALLSFGYTTAEAQQALRSIPADTPNELDTRLRKALQYFV